MSKTRSAPLCATWLNVSSAVRQKSSARLVRHSKPAGQEVLRGRKDRPAATTAVTGEIPQHCKRSITRNRELFPVTSYSAGGAASGRGSYLTDGSVLTSTSARMSSLLIADHPGSCAH